MIEKNTNVCVVNTAYPLMLYLLYSDEEVINKTLFVVGDNIIGQCEKLKNVMYVPQNQIDGRVKMIWFRIKCLFGSLINQSSQIFGQDHLPFSAPLIGNHKYTLIEDGPGVFSIYKGLSGLSFNYNARNMLHRIRNILYGPITERYLGNNSQCVNRIITRYDANSALLKDKKHTLVDLNALWNSSTENKKNLVLEVFGVDQKELILLERPHILFTQPLMVDCGFSEDEEMRLYKDIILKYSNEESLVIKPHPRDLLDYNKYFPTIPVMKTKAPMQLFGAMGYNFKKAITISSSSVSCFSSSTEIIWLGTKIDDRICNFYGNIEKPYSL